MTYINLYRINQSVHFIAVSESANMGLLVSLIIQWILLLRHHQQEDLEKFQTCEDAEREALQSTLVWQSPNCYAVDRLLISTTERPPALVFFVLQQQLSCYIYIFFLFFSQCFCTVYKTLLPICCKYFRVCIFCGTSTAGAG